MIIWTEYMRYRVELRGFDLAKVEEIVRFSTERYVDRVTGREVVVGRHDESLVVIPYETSGEDITPVTVHRTTRQQISSRVKSGRYVHG